MRALTIDAHGGLERLTFRSDVAAPELGGANDVRVRLTSAALNRLDLFVVGGLPGVKITPPWVLGADGTGRIESVGSAVANVKPGDRVVLNPGISCGACTFCRSGEQSMCVSFALLGEHRPGTFAEFVVVPSRNVRRIPDAVTDSAAAAFPLATLTAWRMAVTRAQVRAGDHVLIQGIGGGVAIAALQICKSLGAHVWVTSGSDEKLSRATSLGADETINYRTSDVAKEIRSRTSKRGVDVVLDSAGRASWSSSLGALGGGGGLVTCGASTGPMVETDVRKLFWNQWSIMGSTMGNDREFDTVVAELAAGRLTPPVDSVFPLADGRAAFERMAGGEQFGKIVLTIGP